jgi:hypothetical protein
MESQGPRTAGLTSRPSKWALIVAAATVVGFALRVTLVDQSLLGDELASYWVVTRHSGLGGVLDVVHSDAEITPPLYFLLAKLTTQIDATPAMMRLPSLLAGTASIPLTYLVGRRTVGAVAGAVAALLVAASPFMVYYSTEARGYGLMMFLLLLSTAALLRALDSGAIGWWVLYAGASCAAMYTHYTAAFVLAAQALWALWANPEARRAVIFANLGAALAFLPWLSGTVADFNSPTTPILSALQPFTPDAIRSSLEHFSIGFPYALVPLHDIPGTAALVLLSAGIVLGIAGLWTAHRGAGPPRLGGRDTRRLVLLVAMVVGVLGGEALFSLLSTNLFGTRNLAAAWTPCALLLAALLCSGRRPLAIVASALVVAGLGWGSVKMLGTNYQRPDFASAAGVIVEESEPPAPVVVARSPSPGPLSPIDAELPRHYPIFRLGLSSKPPGDPFAAAKPPPAPQAVAAEAARRAGGGKIFMITPYAGPGAYDPNVTKAIAALPPRYRLVEKRVYDGLIPMALLVYEGGNDRAAG